MAQGKLKSMAAPARKAPTMRRAPVPTQQCRTASASIRSLMGSAGPQFKLTVGAANDPAEREADAVADRVVAMSSADVAVSRTPGTSRQQPVRLLLSGSQKSLHRSSMDQPSTDTLEKAPELPDDLKEIDLPKDEDVVTEALGTEELKEIESGTPAGGSGDPAAAPKRATGTSEHSGDGHPMGPEGGEAPAEIAHAIEHPGQGRALPDAVRQDLEPRFGADFSDVRIHDRPADRKATAAIGARAFAYKKGVWLGKGERADNRRLMAHELTHVLQQTGHQNSALFSDRAKASRTIIHRFWSIKDAILSKVASYARHIPGYTLLSYLLGKDPLTGKVVQPSTETFIYALMGLLPGGTLLADRLKETRVLQKAYDWVNGQVTKLNLSWSRIKGVVSKAADAVTSWSPLENVKKAFRPLYDDIVTFVGAAKTKIQELIVQGALALAGPHAKKVWGVLQKAGDAINLILADPLQFVKNFFKAVVTGFGRFFANIGTHLKAGLMGFIFGAMEGVKITLPQKLDLKGLLSVVLQILNLTWEAIRVKLIKRLKPNGERKVAILEKTVQILKLLVTKGILGVWQKLVSMIDNFTKLVVGGIRDLLLGTLVPAALGWLAGLSNPVGAVAKVILTIYNFVVTLIERMQQIMDFVSSLFGSIYQIAKGNLKKASEAVEKSLARTVPLILAFLAALIPVSGIASKIQGVIKKLRKPVDRAVDRFIKFIVKKAKKVLAKIIGKLNSKRKLPGTTFKVGKKTHKMYAKQKGKKASLFVKSEEDSQKHSEQEIKAQAKIFQEKISDKSELKEILEFIRVYDSESDDAEKISTLISFSKRNLDGAKVAKLKVELEEFSALISKYGLKLADNDHVDTSDESILIRYGGDISDLEGKAGLAGALGTVGKTLNKDHVPTKGVLKTVREWLEFKEKSKSKGTKRIYYEPTKKALKNIPDHALGFLSSRTIDQDSDSFPAIVISNRYNKTQSPADTKLLEKTSKAIGTNKGGTPIRNLSEVKNELRDHINEKTQQILDAYSNEQKGTLDRVTAGTKHVKKISRNYLKLSGAKAENPNDPGPATGLFRTYPFNKKEPPDEKTSPNFLKEEGEVDSHINNRRNQNTFAGVLNADHNPEKANIKSALEWNFSEFEKRHQGAPKATGGTGDLTEGLGAASYDDEYSGTMVISAEVHADFGTTVDPSVVELAKKSAQRAYISRGVAHFDQYQTTKDATELKKAKKPIVAAINQEFKTEIEARVWKILRKYKNLEEPKVRRLNSAQNTPKAIGMLAKITQKIHSTAQRRKLEAFIDKWFPTP